MTLNVAITGATGFIGSAVVKELRNRGMEVTVLLRPYSNSSRLHDISGVEAITYHRLTDSSVVRDLAKRKPDVFIHCGWRGVTAGEREEVFQFTDNVPNTIDSVVAAAASGCRQWIGMGSQAEYGNLNSRINEDAEPQPVTKYGAAKLAAGRSAHAVCRTLGIKSVWLRIFSTYGPGDHRGCFIPYAVQEFLAGRSPKLTKCEQLWDYLYIDDAARAVATIADGQTSGTYNLGSGTARVLKDYTEAIREQIGGGIAPQYGAVPYGPNQIMHLQADISRITAETGWRPQTPLRQGINDVISFERQRLAG